MKFILNRNLSTNSECQLSLVVHSCIVPCMKDGWTLYFFVNGIVICLKRMVLLLLYIQPYLVVGIGFWCKSPGFCLTSWKQMEKKLRTWQRFGYLFTCPSAILYSNQRLAKQWNPRLLAILWFIWTGWSWGDWCRAHFWCGFIKPIWSLFIFYFDQSAT